MENTDNKQQLPPRFYYKAMWVYIVTCLIFASLSVVMIFDRAEDKRKMSRLNTEIAVTEEKIKSLQEKIDLHKKMDELLERMDDLKRELEEIKEKHKEP